MATSIVWVYPLFVRSTGENGCLAAKIDAACAGELSRTLLRLGLRYICPEANYILK